MLISMTNDRYLYLSKILLISIHLLLMIHEFTWYELIWSISNQSEMSIISRNVTTKLIEHSDEFIKSITKYVLEFIRYYLSYQIVSWPNWINCFCNEVLVILSVGLFQGAIWFYPFQSCFSSIVVICHNCLHYCLVLLINHECSACFLKLAL